MPPSSGVLRVGRYFLSLLVILGVLWGLVFLPGKTHSPKLGLDLQGGAQIIFRAQTENGKAPSKAAMKVARQILTDRVNGSGVQESEVVQQGSDRIVVSVPGKSTEDIADIGAAAKLNFRPLVMPVQQAAPTPANTGTPTSAGSSSSSSSGSSKSSSSNPKSSGTNSSTSAPGNIAAPQKKTAVQNVAPSGSSAKSSAAKPKSPSSGLPAPFNQLGFALPTSEAAYSKMDQTQQQELQYALQQFSCKSEVKDVAKQGMPACSTDGKVKYLLGAVIIPGDQISSASAQPPDTSGQGGSAQWTVQLNLKGSGQTAWSKYTAAHNTNNAEDADPSQCGASAYPCADFVGFTLDNKVISAPSNQSAINAATSITGSFNEDSATELANQLKYGSLPLNFQAETKQNVSATLGTSQLKAGMLAGGIGLILVVLYSLLYYRGLGLVTIASLLVSGALTYSALVILGREISFTLTMAGIAGFIVAIGITADSFVVFFERIKDEVHDGRSMRVAVPRAWIRARRTIISADFVSFLAAAVLYYLASGDVKGFAFTLGMSTILDLVVVFLFTHPLISVLSRSRAFGSARFTGLNAIHDAGLVLAGAGAGTVAPTTHRVRVAAERGDDSADDEDRDEQSVEDVEEETVEPEQPEPKKPVKVTVGASAAERAAARRGLKARPAKKDEQPAEKKQSADKEPEAKAAEVAETDDAASAKRRRPSRSRDREPQVVADEPDAAQEDEPVEKKTTPASSAAERAAARRRRRAPEPEPEPEPEEPQTAEPEPEPEVEEAAAEEAAVEEAAAEDAPTASNSDSAADRAAARRARIRARAAQKDGDR